jgi:outer membrane immunogenic protein
MSHRLLLTTVAAAAFIGAPALAQDYDWTGFYVGGNLGASWGDTSLDIEAGPGASGIVLPAVDAGLINGLDTDDDNKTSFTGGLELGYNYQSGSIVFGLESDLSFLDLDQQRTVTVPSGLLINPPVTYGLDQRVKTEWLWTLRPRLGYASGPWMVYATGGIATTKIKLRTNYGDNGTPPTVATLDESDTDTGWTGGLGGAYALGPNWSVKGEWLYLDFGNVRQTVATPNGFATITSEAKVRANIFRLGMDYKF